ncbi:MAG: glutamate--tRNA ligase [Bacteroidota bacterium]
MENIRVRFAPSPTGGLHIGGVRTALFNYLYAKKHNGTFILRIEDTDQNRFVEGAEQYIIDALAWCGIYPDEGPVSGGPHAPYRQSERKEIYQQYANQLIEAGHAYYAFDSVDELEAMRNRLKEGRIANPQYDAVSRTTMKNSLTLSPEEVKSRIESGDPYVIRFKVQPKEEVRINDIVRGWVLVHGSNIDDKILMKSDGMPTYHLANVVDDHLMNITHVIRGEEWLPSAPLHVLLYKYLGWESSMPRFAHLPLILKPDGNGKLSKRAADKAGFPIFPMSWTDPQTSEESVGFKETGYLPEAMVNFLALLGWNPGSEKELFNMDELINHFSLEKINKAGTKFDIEKANWFNQQYIKAKSPQDLGAIIQGDLKSGFGIDCSAETAIQIVDLLKERVTFVPEFAKNSLFLFQHPKSYDQKIVEKKWDEDAVTALDGFAAKIKEQTSFTADEVKDLFFSTLEENGFNAGKFMQPLRLCMTGEGSGPDLMSILSIMGGKSVSERIFYSIDELNRIKAG